MFYKCLDEACAIGQCVNCLQCTHYTRECTALIDAKCGIPYDVDIIYPMCITLYIMYVLVAVSYYWVRSNETKTIDSFYSDIP